MFRLGLLFICLPFATFAKDSSFEKFLTTHCVSSHGPKKEKRDLSIDNLSRDFKAGMDSHLWAEVNERINAGKTPQIFEFESFLEMPTQLHFSVVANDIIDRRGGGDFRGALASRNWPIFSPTAVKLTF
jgi:hypothetical protein